MYVLFCLSRRVWHVALASVFAAVIVASTLAACSASPGPEDDEGPSITSSLTPEEQDDAVFEDLYAGYNALSLESETEGDLKAFLTGDALNSDLADLNESHRSGQRIVGRDTYSGFQVTDRGTDPDGATYMTAQTCLDVSGTRVLDASGQDVTPARDDRLSLQMKAIRLPDGTWRISDFVRNEDVHACD